MGFFDDYVRPNTHAIRNNAHAKPNTKCCAPGCSKKAKPGQQYHGTCGKAACQGYVAGGW
jgi:hypothetical protein